MPTQGQLEMMERILKDIDYDDFGIQDGDTVGIDHNFNVWVKRGDADWEIVATVTQWRGSRVG